MNDKPVVSPFIKLLYSRKVILALIDAIVSTALYLVGKFGGPDTLEAAKYMIVLWQPLVITIIVGITVEDAAQKRAGTKAADDALEASRAEGYVQGYEAATAQAYDAKHSDHTDVVRSRL